MRIFIVQGTSGAYEEEKTWVVCAYVDKADADKHASAANEAAEAYYESIKDAPFSYSSKGVREYVGSLDPHAEARGSYRAGGATEYSIVETELNDSFALG